MLLCYYSRILQRLINDVKKAYFCAVEGNYLVAVNVFLHESSLLERSRGITTYWLCRIQSPAEFWAWIVFVLTRPGPGWTRCRAAVLNSTICNNFAATLMSKNLLLLLVTSCSCQFSVALAQTTNQEINTKFWKVSTFIFLIMEVQQYKNVSWGGCE